MYVSPTVHVSNYLELSIAIEMPLLHRSNSCNQDVQKLTPRSRTPIYKLDGVLL